MRTSFFPCSIVIVPCYAYTGGVYLRGATTFALTESEAGLDMAALAAHEPE